MNKLVRTILIVSLALLISSGILWAVSDIEKKWLGTQTVAQTNAYGGVVGDLAADEAYDYTSNIDLYSNGYEGTQITLTYQASGASDDIMMSVFPSPNGVSFDTVAYLSMTCFNNAAASTQQTILVQGLKQFRIGVKCVGGTDTFDYEVLSDPWNWEY